MAGPEDRAPWEQEAAARGPAPLVSGYGRYVGLLAIVIVILITINTIVTKPNGASGIAPGAAVPPFATPLATGNLGGESDVAVHAGEGAAGNVPACKERGAEILNVCQLYEQGPVVLALFVDGGGCEDVLAQMQALSPSFPTVRFAGVSIKGSTGELRKLIRKQGLTFPVGIDRDGALAALYKVASCPQVSFISRGGVMQSKALLSTPTPAVLRRRVAALAAGSAG